MTDAEIQKSNYHFYKSIGICTSCGTRPAVPGVLKCERCSEKANMYQRDYEAKHKEERNTYKRILYEERKRNGICVRCKKKATHGLYCYEHSIREKRLNKRRVEEQRTKNYGKISITEQRKAQGLCLWCWQPTDGKSNACDKHKEIFAKNLAKGREVYRKMNDEDFKRMKRRNGKVIEGRTGTS